MIGQTIGELLSAHVTLDVEGIDRLYLNAYQPRLQTGSGVAYFFRMHRGAAVASTMLMAPMSHAFVTAIEAFAKREQIDRKHTRTLRLHIPKKQKDRNKILTLIQTRLRPISRFDVKLERYSWIY